MLNYQYSGGMAVLSYTFNGVPQSPTSTILSTGPSAPLTLDEGITVFTLTVTNPTGEFRTSTVTYTVTAPLTPTSNLTAVGPTTIFVGTAPTLNYDFTNGNAVLYYIVNGLLISFVPIPAVGQETLLPLSIQGSNVFSLVVTNATTLASESSIVVYDVI